MLVPLALMAAALAMQHLERHLLGPAPSTEETPLPGGPRRPARL